MESKDNGSSSNLDYGFAFNNIKFSDRVLRIEIEQDDKTEFRSLGISISDLILRLKGKRKKKKDNEKLCSIKVKSIHISSPILSAKSTFFLNLFSNGMKESNERIVTLRIHSSEEDALMELLNFMYTNTLQSATTSSSLVDLLMIADKFQVSSCFRYCIRLLSDLPMTYESASHFLYLSSTVTMPEEVQPLTDAAKKYIADCYKDITRFEEELINFPLAEIELILSSDLQVTSADDVYDFVLKWARKNYPIIHKRREILTTRLAPLIRLQNMSVTKLKSMLTCNEFDHTYASKAVKEALSLKKAESSHLHTIHASRTHPHCTVYLDLKKEVFDDLQPTNRVFSELFRLGGKWFYLYAIHTTEPSDSLGLFLGMCANQSGSCSVAYEFLARSKPTEKFVSIDKFTYTLDAGFSYGQPNVFGISWSQFIAQTRFISSIKFFILRLRL